MRTSNFLFFLLISIHSLYGQDWELIESFSPAQTFQDMLVLDNETIYGSTATYSGFDLQIKVSRDGGLSWSSENTGFPDMPIRAIASPDGEEVFGIGNDGVLIRNRGTSEWEAVDFTVNMPLRCIQFISEELGFIGSDAGTLFRTIDGGDTWIDFEAEIPQVGTVSEMHFINETTGFICGFNYMQRTDDGGQSWDYVSGFTPADGLFQLVDFFFLDETIGFAAGDVGLLYRTNDGGDSWQKLETGIESSIRAVHFLNENLGFICAFDGLILRTEDGGESWSTMSAPSTEHMRAMTFMGNRGFIGTHVGELLQYTDVSTSINETDHKNVSVFPNPCTDFLKVDQWPSFAEYEIYNTTGELLSRAQTYNGKIDVSSLTQGSYFLRWISEDGSMLVPFVKS